MNIPMDAFEILWRHRMQIDSMTGYLLEPKIEEQNVILSQLGKRCDKERQFVEELRKINDVDSMDNDEKRELLDTEIELYEKELEALMHKTGKNRIDQETQYEAKALIDDPEDEKMKLEMEGLATWKQALLMGCRSFQLLRQLLQEQRPNSQDKWLKHVKAIEEIYFRDL